MENLEKLIESHSLAKSSLDKYKKLELQLRKQIVELIAGKGQQKKTVKVNKFGMEITAKVNTIIAMDADEDGNVYLEDDENIENLTAEEADCIFYKLTLDKAKLTKLLKSGDASNIFAYLIERPATPTLSYKEV